MNTAGTTSPVENEQNFEGCVVYNLMESYLRKVHVENEQNYEGFELGIPGSNALKRSKAWC